MDQAQISTEPKKKTAKYRRNKKKKEMIKAKKKKLQFDSGSHPINQKKVQPTSKIKVSQSKLLNLESLANENLRKGSLNYDPEKINQALPFVKQVMFGQITSSQSFIQKLQVEHLPKMLYAIENANSLCIAWKFWTQFIFNQKEQLERKQQSILLFGSVFHLVFRSREWMELYMKAGSEFLKTILRFRINKPRLDTKSNSTIISFALKIAKEASEDDKEIHHILRNIAGMCNAAYSSISAIADSAFEREVIPLIDTRMIHQSTDACHALVGLFEEDEKRQIRKTNEFREVLILSGAVDEIDALCYCKDTDMQWRGALMLREQFII